ARGMKTPKWPAHVGAASRRLRPTFEQVKAALRIQRNLETFGVGSTSNPASGVPACGRWQSGQKRNDASKIRNRQRTAPAFRHIRLEKNRTETSVLSTDDVPPVVASHEERICGRHFKQR